MEPHNSRPSKRRSRSPLLDGESTKVRRRSRSPKTHHHHHHRHHRPSSQSHAPQQPLPLQATPLQRRDFETYKPMFALYLDVQKQLVLEDLEQEEVKGRWKSFMSKWNHGDLAEGWYDPATLRKAQTSATDSHDSPPTRHRPSPPRRSSPPTRNRFEEENETRENDASSEEDIIGPTLPNQSLLHPSARAKGKAPGPSIPNTKDLALRSELESEDLAQCRSDLHHERKSDRQLQKAQLEELVPRAEAGSKERMLEKKREKSDANRAFASAKGDAMEEVGEADLMGGDDGGVEGFKKRKVVEERKKNEREVRKDEILRARREEREERVRAYQEREERTMSGLVALARARFG